MNFEQLEALVNYWADKNGLTEKATPLAQADKTLEEANEIREALEAGSLEQLIDGIGDTLVTLIVQCKLNNLSATGCLEAAWEEIKDREGKMINGQFVKA